MCSGLRCPVRRSNDAQSFANTRAAATLSTAPLNTMLLQQPSLRDVPTGDTSEPRCCMRTRAVQA